MKFLSLVLFCISIASVLRAQRVVEWYGYGDDGYYDYYGGSIDYTKLFWGIVLGVAIQRFFEKKFDADESWLKTILMSFWFATPLSVVFVLYVF